MNNKKEIAKSNHFPQVKEIKEIYVTGTPNLDPLFVTKLFGKGPLKSNQPVFFFIVSERRELPFYFSDTPLSRHWHSTGTSVALQWHSTGTSVAFQWHFSSTPLELFSEKSGSGYAQERRRVKGCPQLSTPRKIIFKHTVLSPNTIC